MGDITKVIGIGWLSCCDKIHDLCSNEFDLDTFTQKLLEILSILNFKLKRDQRDGSKITKNH